MNKRQFTSHFFSILLIVASSLLACVFPIVQSRIFTWVEENLAGDYHLAFSKRLILAVLYYALLILLAGWGVVRLQNRTPRFVTIFKQLVSTDSGTPSYSPWRMFIGSSLLGVFLSGVYLVTYIVYGRNTYSTFLYMEDGLFEWLTAIAFLASWLWMFQAAVSLAKRSGSDAQIRIVVILYAIIAFVFFFIAMEEISWGQRIFGWGTPDLFAGNYQHETNIHNFFNPLFPLFYALGAYTLLASVLVSGWLISKGQPSRFARLVLPHLGLITVAVCLIIAAITLTVSGLYDELVGLAALFYSFRAARLASG